MALPASVIEGWTGTGTVSISGTLASALIGFLSSDDIRAPHGAGLRDHSRGRHLRDLHAHRARTTRCWTGRSPRRSPRAPPVSPAPRHDERAGQRPASFRRLDHRITASQGRGLQRHPHREGREATSPATRARQPLGQRFGRPGVRLARQRERVRRRCLDRKCDGEHLDSNVVLTVSDGAGHTGTSNAFNVAVPPDYFTQWFGAGWTEQTPTIRAGSSTPDGSNSFYSVARSLAGLRSRPIRRAASTLTLSDDNYLPVTPAGGAQVKLYGMSYSSSMWEATGTSPWHPGIEAWDRDRSRATFSCRGCRSV